MPDREHRSPSAGKVRTLPKQKGAFFCARLGSLDDAYIQWLDTKHTALNRFKPSLKILLSCLVFNLSKMLFKKHSQWEISNPARVSKVFYKPCCPA